MPARRPTLITTMTLTDKLRRLFGGIIDRIASFLARSNIKANHITAIGFGGNCIAALLIARGYFLAGGIMAGFNCLLDAIDGAIARQSGGESRYGSFLDSTLDRYSELVLHFGLLVFYIFADNNLGIALSFLSFSGSILVSYIRARGEGLGIIVKQGVFTRVERLVVLIVSLLIGRPIAGLAAVAILSHLTALQRFWISRQILVQKENTNND